MYEEHSRNGPAISSKHNFAAYSVPQPLGTIPDASSFAQNDVITITWRRIARLVTGASVQVPSDLAPNAQRASGNPQHNLASSWRAAGLVFLPFSRKRGPLPLGFLAWILSQMPSCAKGFASQTPKPPSGSERVMSSVRVTARPGPGQVLRDPHRKLPSGVPPWVKCWAGCWVLENTTVFSHKGLVSTYYKSGVALGTEGAAETGKGPALTPSWGTDI